jgi:hypothetical protein
MGRNYGIFLPLPALMLNAPFQRFFAQFWPPVFLWLAIMVAQAYLTPIHSDEAYYWMYAQRLDWGYFDHPPLAALLIRVGTVLIPGVLGVRLFTILSVFGVIYVLHKLLVTHHTSRIDESTYHESQNSLFWFLIFLLPLLHIYSFISTPDAPLLLAVALFFWSYHGFLSETKHTGFLGRLRQIFPLGICMALMLYAKYHGVLVILFVLLSNVRLILDWRWYAAILIGFCLFLPHIWWQYQHDWVSVRFHLDERRGVSLWYHQLEYLGNVLVLFNPFLAWLVWKWAPSSNLFERALKFVFWGMIVFFSFQTIRDHVQPQWLIACYVPFVLLTVPVLSGMIQKYQWWSGGVSAAILLFLHFALIFDVLPDHLGVHRKAERSALIEQLAQGNPVLFLDSYQNASAYAWYTRNSQVHTLHSGANRKSQFALWQLDTAYHNRSVLVVGGQWSPMPLKDVGLGFWADTFRFSCYEHLIISDLRIEAQGDITSISGKVINCYTFPMFPQQNQIGVEVAQLIDRKVVGDPIRAYLDVQALQPKESMVFEVVLPKRVELGQLGVGVCRKGWPATAYVKVASGLVK